MSSIESTWKFAEEQGFESEAITLARGHALELGIPVISPAQGAQLAVVAAAIGAEQILELGTGTGVSGLHLLHGAPEATLTSIDSELEYQQLAKQAFALADVAGNRLRLIAGRVQDVLPRMNDASYDLFVLQADARQVLEFFEHALRLVRPGGSILVAHVLLGGRLADPTKRDAGTVDLRTLLASVAERDDLAASLSMTGTGLLHVVKRVA